jgi:DNA primase
MPYLDFRAIKARVAIHDVLDHYNLTAYLKKAGQTLTGKCPIHQGDRGDSFRVSLDKNCFNCFSCQAHGNQLDLVVALEKCSLKEAGLKMMEWFGLQEAQRPPQPQPHTKVANPPPQKHEPANPTPAPVSTPVKPAPAVAVFNRPLGFSLADKLDYSHPYLAERGLDEATIREFGVGFCNAGTLIARVAIPIHTVGGELVGYVGRWPGEPPAETPKYKLPKGFRKSVELFNLHRALTEASELPLVVVEGFFDVFHLWRYGVRRVVSLMGCNLSDYQESLLREHAFGTRILVMLDEDDAGRNARGEIATRLAHFAYVRVQSLPTEGCQPDHLTPEQIDDAIHGRDL